MSRPLTPLIVSSLQRISGQHIPEECTNNEKGTVVHRAKGHFLCYRKVGLNILISIEHLLTITSSLKD
jgi:hypothetical protein